MILPKRSKKVVIHITFEKTIGFGKSVSPGITLTSSSRYSLDLLFPNFCESTSYCPIIYLGEEKATTHRGKELWNGRV